MAGNAQETNADGIAHALSRALFRRLSQSLPEGSDAAARQRVLDACEMTMGRLFAEPDFARPARFLFEEIRSQFPLAEQLWVRQTVDRHLELARSLVERFPAPRRECNAFTRAGQPCQRETVAGSEFCPSHRHLELVGDGRAGTST